ncbi:MAG: M1 family metallopeptidase [Chitinophagales bacterium]|nr:M1 family metallopeptidase [Chitinophagales bacterium]
MMKKNVLIAIFLLTAMQGGAQYSKTDSLKNNLCNGDNQLYWKNRLPFPGYWQQDVYYEIDADINEKTGIIDGKENLTYWNNSHDTLSFVYFHLYQQAFVKGGYIEDLNIHNNFKQVFGKYEAAGLGEIIESIQIAKKDLKTESDFSVVKVYLTTPLLPNDSTVFSIKFKTYFDNGTQRRRMKKFSVFGFTHYDGVHWYPRICVYDRKFGWDTDQHLGKEFYGDFGTYDVQLSFSSNYIVGATGVLQNREECLSKELREKLDLKNFADKPWESKPSNIIPYDSTHRKTWHFFAQNVHDFAWTADPAYRLAEAQVEVYDPETENTRVVNCEAFAEEQHAAGWQNAALYTAKVIDVYSSSFGAYSWPNLIVADARDGMEYPMLTLDGGYSPNYFDLIAHEVGHEWFFGQVANNETYRAALDEGFAQFIESWGLIQIFGDTLPHLKKKENYYDHFKKQISIRDGEVYLGYLREASRGTDESINQHSDAFNGALKHGGGYSQVYFKTATMLWNLQYVLGDSLFQASIKHYFNQWKFCHPYFEDFRNSIIQFTHVDLNWFFDEWMETTKTIDYGVKKVKHKNDDHYSVILNRRGRSQMPVDLEIEAKNGNKYAYYIPNNWFQKSTTATVLPKWYGWDKLHPDYRFIVSIPSGIRNITIDPSFRMADVYMLNNSKKIPVQIAFDSQINNFPSWKNYQMLWRPDIWYNAIDGIKAGLHLEGDYFGIIDKFSLTAWYNTRLLPNGFYNYHIEDSLAEKTSRLSFNFSYSSNTHRFIKNSSVNFSFEFLDGLWGGSAGFTIQPNLQNLIGVEFKSMYRAKQHDLQYLLYPEQWKADEWNNTAKISYELKYQYYKGTGDIGIVLRSSSLFSDYQYSYAALTVINRNHLGLLDFSTRFFARAGSGTPALESALYLAGGSPEDLMENKFVRSKGFVPDKWLGYGSSINHFQQGGGLNLRGYAGYLAPELSDDQQNYLLYFGNTGIAVNGEVDFDNYIKVAPNSVKNWLKVDTYIFADAGSMGYHKESGQFNMSSFYMDGGVGIAATIKKWGQFEKIKPLTLRADFPLLINHLPAYESSYINFRWVIGVGRSF